MPDSESLLLQRMDRLIESQEKLTQAIRELARSNAQIADALLAENTEEGTLEGPQTL